MGLFGHTNEEIANYMQIYSEVVVTAKVYAELSDRFLEDRGVSDSATHMTETKRNLLEDRLAVIANTLVNIITPTYEQTVPKGIRELIERQHDFAQTRENIRRAEEFVK